MKKERIREYFDNKSQRYTNNFKTRKGVAQLKNVYRDSTDSKPPLYAYLQVHV